MGQRFFQVTKGVKDVSVQLWLEFLGEKAKMVHGRDWSFVAEEYFVDKRPGVNGEISETARLYLQMPSAGFDRAVVNAMLNLLDVSEDFCKLQFHRENGARIVHYRPSDENPFLGGFGQPNPHTISDKFPDGRKCHNDFSEPFVDRKPGSIFTNYKGEEGQVWEDFKPVYLKVKPADGRDEYYLKIWTEWCDNEIFVMSETNPADTPQELRDYEFLAKNKTQELDEFEEATIKKYAHRPRIRN